MAMIVALLWYFTSVNGITGTTALNRRVRPAINRRATGGERLLKQPKKERFSLLERAFTSDSRLIYRPAGTVAP
jgi:hypothetical protein